MSTVKTTNITHASNSGTANVVLDSSGNATVASGLHIGSANQTKTVDGVLIERNTGDGMAHITAGRAGGNF